MGRKRVNLKNKEVQDILVNPERRAERILLVKQDFKAYIFAYLQKKFQLPPAPFHKKLIEDLQDDSKRFYAVMGFRGSAKTTILEAYAEWLLVTGRSNFIVWIGASDTDAKESVMNIKSSIEENPKLRADFGIDIVTDKKKIAEKWTESQLIVGNSTIIARSRGQKIRGRKFRNHRIDTIIVDDLEDTESTRNLEQRKKTRKWFFSEVINATKQGTLGDDIKVVMLGNLVHKDCLLSYLMKSDVVDVYRFPLIDENGEITWKALFPDMEAVEKEKQKVLLAGKGMGEIIWQREYLLKLIDEEDQIIKYSDIQTYDPSWLQKPFVQGGVGIDLAISKKQTADFTAMVKGVVVKNDYGERRILVLPNAIRERLDFSETIQKAIQIKAEMPDNTTFFVEDVAYQKAAIEVMRKNGLLVKPMRATTDKRSRLMSVSSYIKSGVVLFPKEGLDDIIEEVVNFGVEEHDDGMDALVHLITGLTDTKEVVFI